MLVVTAGVDKPGQLQPRKKSRAPSSPMPQVETTRAAACGTGTAVPASLCVIPGGPGLIASVATEPWRNLACLRESRLKYPKPHHATGLVPLGGQQW